MLENRNYEATEPQRSPLQRRFPRVRVDIPIVYSMVGDNVWQNARITDLSGGGLRISAAADLVPGAQITLGFNLPQGEQKVLTAGRIVMSFFDGPTQQYSHGVAYTRMSHADQEAIVKHVNDALRLNSRFFTAPALGGRSV